MESNERKVNYNKEIQAKYWNGHLVKTNPIQSQSPAFGRKSEALSSKSEITVFSRTQFEKTKPICRLVKLAQMPI